MGATTAAATACLGCGTGGATAGPGCGTGGAAIHGPGTVYALGGAGTPGFYQ